MKKFKLGIGSSLAALALVVGLSVPASAQPVETGPGDNTNTTTINLGDCAGIITSVVVQTAANTAVNAQSNQSNGGGVLNDEGDQSNTGSSSASSVQEGGVYFAPNCSKTTNVNHTTVKHEHKHVTQAAATQSSAVSSQGASRHGAGSFTVAASQAPSGGVSAGAGGSFESAIAPLAGVIGSLATIGFGAVRLLKFEA